MTKKRAVIMVLNDLGVCLHGRVYGHPDFENGTLISTSRVIRRSLRRVETRNTVYRPIWQFARGIN